MRTPNGLPSFILDKPKSTTPTTVFLQMEAVDGRLKYSTGLKVPPSNWAQQRMTGIFRPGNTTLNRLQQRCEELLLERRVKGTVLTKQYLRDELDKITGRYTESVTSDFFSVIAEIIADREAGRELTKGGKVYSKKTIDGYRHTLDYLVKFEAFNRKPLAFETASMQTYKALYNFFSAEHQQAINTVGKHLKNYGVFLRGAFARKIHHNRVFDDEGFTIPKEDTNDIALTDVEINTLAEIELTGVQLLARDWFVIQAYTGLRVSDVKRLTDQNLADDRIMISNEKTDVRVVIPVHPHVRRVLERWAGVPAPLSDQKINLHIKEVAKKAEIKDRVLYTFTKAGKRVDTYYEKWEMISNHTGRRTFVTNLIRYGVPSDVIMRLTGIRKFSTMQRYNKLTEEENADIAAGLAFFK